MPDASRRNERLPGPRVDAPRLAHGATLEAAPPARANRPTAGDYARVGMLLSLYCGLLSWLVVRGGGRAVAADQLVAPMAALVALVALVWLLMVVLRNYAALSGAGSASYYLTYELEPPPDWIERPARTFNNLMQLPTLFYVVCLIMMVRGRCDEAQVAIAWLYMATRALHAVVYIGWNPLPYRFASWVASSIALGVLWWRMMSLG